MTTKLLSLSLAVAFLTACALFAPQKYLTVWQNKPLATKVGANSFEYGEKLDYDRAECDIKSMEVVIPARDCKVVSQSSSSSQRDANRTQSSGASKSQSSSDTKCVNDAAIRAAKKNKANVFKFCMLKRKWREIKEINPEWVEWKRNQS